MIIVDLQEDFLPPKGSLAVANGREIIPKVVDLLNGHNWATVLVTKDWHPANHTSFASNHNDCAPYSELEFIHPNNEIDPLTKKPLVKKQILWPDHCIQNTPGSQLASEFEPLLEEFTKSSSIPTSVVTKGYLVDREYYSCFQDTWGVHKTELNELLVKLEATHVFVVGLAYDFCVLNTAIDASKLGYQTFVVKDCAKSVYPDKEAETDTIYTENGVKIISSEDQLLKF